MVIIMIMTTSNVLFGEILADKGGHRSVVVWKLLLHKVLQTRKLIILQPEHSGTGTTHPGGECTGTLVPAGTLSTWMRRTSVRTGTRAMLFRL